MYMFNSVVRPSDASELGSQMKFPVNPRHWERSRAHTQNIFCLQLYALNCALCMLIINWIPNWLCGNISDPHRMCLQFEISTNTHGIIHAYLYAAAVSALAKCTAHMCACQIEYAKQICAKNEATYTQKNGTSLHHRIAFYYWCQCLCAGAKCTHSDVHNSSSSPPLLPPPQRSRM